MKYFLLRVSYAFYIDGLIRDISGFSLEHDVWVGMFIFDSLTVANILFSFVILFYEGGYLNKYVSRQVLKYVYLVAALSWNFFYLAYIYFYADIRIDELVSKKPIIAALIYIGVLFVSLTLFCVSDYRKKRIERF